MTSQGQALLQAAPPGLGDQGLSPPGARRPEAVLTRCVPSPAQSSLPGERARPGQPCSRLHSPPAFEGRPLSAGAGRGDGPGCRGLRVAVGVLPSPSPCPQDPAAAGMAHRHSDSSLEEKLLECRFHSELRLDTNGNPISGLPAVRGSLRVRDNAASQHDVPGPAPPTPEGREPRAVILSTQSPAALKMGTEQLIPRSLAVSSRAKAPARHQSFGAAMLSKEAARRDPQRLVAPSFSLDDMDVATGPGGMLTRKLRNQSYRAAMKGPGAPGGELGPISLSPKLQALAEESSQPPARHAAKNKVRGCAPGQPEGTGLEGPASVAAPPCRSCRSVSTACRLLAVCLRPRAGCEQTVKVLVLHTRPLRLRKGHGFTRDPGHPLSATAGGGAWGDRP